jgi:hypothetical protein
VHPVRGLDAFDAPSDQLLNLWVVFEVGAVSD